MDTTIGNAFVRKPQQAAALFIGVLVVVLDVTYNYQLSRLSLRLPIAIAGATMLFWLSGFNRAAVGLVWCPSPNFWYWWRATGVISLMAAILVAVVGFVLYFSGTLTPEILSRNLIHVADIPATFVSMCFLAPFEEEICYRLVLCAPAVVVFKPRGAIVLSGTAFAALHWVYGNPSPENQLGGFVLAWAFLKSGTIWVPIMWHALGNCGALLMQVLTWNWFVDSAGI